MNCESCGWHTPTGPRCWMCEREPERPVCVPVGEAHPRTEDDPDE